MKEILLERRSQETDEICTATTSLLTSFRSDMQAYGVMFTVQSKETPITILTMEFSAMITTNDAVHIMVYTKPGDYHGYQAIPNAWTRLVDLDIIPARTGRGTIIPLADFVPVLLGINDLRSFYVTLDTPNLRYTGASGVQTGKPYAQDDALQIHAGAGLLEYPFSANLFEPRLFNGAIHYRRHVPCNSQQEPSDVTVPFVFLVQYDGNSSGGGGLVDSVLLDSINTAVQSSMRDMLENDPQLVAQLAFAGSTTESAASAAVYPTEAVSDCRTTTTRQCDAVLTRLQLQFKPDSLNAGMATHLMLQHRATLTTKIDANLPNIDLVYLGAIPVQTQLTINLQGIPSNQEMDENIQDYFQDVVANLLTERLMSSFRVLSVQVKGQELLTRDGRAFAVKSQQQQQQRRRGLAGQQRLLQSDTSFSLNVETQVLGMYRPPPFVDFPPSVEYAIEVDGGAYFREELLARRNRPEYPLSDEERTYFDNLSAVGIHRAGMPVASNSTTHYGPLLPVYAIWLLVTFGLLLVLSYCGYQLWKRRQERVREERKAKKVQSTAAVDDYMSRVYDQAFGAFRDNSTKDLAQTDGEEEEEEEDDDKEESGRGEGRHRSISMLDLIPTTPYNKSFKRPSKVVFSTAQQQQQQETPKRQEERGRPVMRASRTTRQSRPQVVRDMSRSQSKSSLFSRGSASVTMDEDINSMGGYFRG